MRTALVLGMVASVAMLSGCGAVHGPGFGQPCDGYGSGAGFFNSGFAQQGCGTEQSFSDSNCGPMCGAYLSDSQTANRGCDQCQVGQSFARGQLANWFGQLNRPMFGRAATGCDSGACDSGGGFVGGSFAGAGGMMQGGLLGTCRGLGSSVGCQGCGECGGGNAIGLNHSGYSNSPYSDGCAGGSCLSGAAKRLLNIPFRPNGSPHPYGGELPHTASATAAGGSAAPTYGYPYYTTRGPRDFLMMKPPSIGR
ncbi:MAG: hypothetical protein AAGA30_18795 [Planctomycetota bacterium]